MWVVISVFDETMSSARSGSNETWAAQWNRT